MKRLHRSWEIAILLICILALNLPLLANAKGSTLGSTYITGNPPTIDGVVKSEGSGLVLHRSYSIRTPPILITTLYVMPTYVYILNDLENLYFLVDAVGDTVANDDDECLLVFGVGDEIFVGEAFGDGTTNPCIPDGVEVNAGFGASMNSATPHRIYEWKIPLASIDASAGQPIDFSSPRYLKFSGPVCSALGIGSMPYDADLYDHDGDINTPPVNRDNIWPPDIPTYVTEDRSDWGILQLQANISSRTGPFPQRMGLDRSLPASRSLCLRVPQKRQKMGIIQSIQSNS